LFAIEAAGSERQDGGRFDDLLAKAVMHHLKSAAGADVPSREMALAPETPLPTWASAVHIDPELRSWLEFRLGQMKPLSTAARAIVAAVPAMNFLGPRLELSLSVLFDIALLSERLAMRLLSTRRLKEVNRLFKRGSTCLLRSSSFCSRLS
jgi:hypothetical protein